MKDSTKLHRYVNVMAKEKEKKTHGDYMQFIEINRAQSLSQGIE